MRICQILLCLANPQVIRPIARGAACRYHLCSVRTLTGQPEMQDHPYSSLAHQELLLLLAALRQYLLQVQCHPLPPPGTQSNILFFGGLKLLRTLFQRTNRSAHTGQARGVSRTCRSSRGLGICLAHPRIPRNRTLRNPLLTSRQLKDLIVSPAG